MQRPRVPVDAKYVAHATYRKQRERADILRLATELTDDPKRTERVAQQLCPMCFYAGSHQIVQPAFTSRPCGDCAEPQTYSNSDTHLLCEVCARNRRLCKRCAAQMSQEPAGG